MRARTRKQGLALAFGKYRHKERIKPAPSPTPEIEAAHKRIVEAESRGMLICWKCDLERTAESINCPRCGAASTPF